MEEFNYQKVLVKILSRYHLNRYAWLIRSLLPCILLTFLLVSTSVATPPQQGFVVGLLRPDGLIIPFAYFNGTEFTNPWQKPGDCGPNEPNTITDLDAPWFSGFSASTDSWFVWYPAGGKRLTTQKPVKIPSHCSEVWAVPTTEVKGKYAENFYDPIKTGLVTNKEIDASPFSISKSGADAQQMLKVLRPSFDQGEKEALTKTGIDAYYERELRSSKQMMKSTTLHCNPVQKAQLTAKQSIYFIEVTKKYPTASDSTDGGCEIISYQKSWVLNGQKATVLSSEFEVTDCHMKNVLTGQSISVLRIKDSVYIVHMNIGYESESYSIFRLVNGKMIQVLKTFGGGC